MKKALLLLLCAALAGGAYGFYQYNKPHPDLSQQAADLTLEATALFDTYEADEAAANARFLDKVVAVRGTVKEARKGSDGVVKVTLDTGHDFGVLCALDDYLSHPRTDFGVGETVTFKGHCTGLNFDVQFVDCVEVVKK